MTPDWIHPGEMMIFAGGRQTGKSTITFQMLKNRGVQSVSNFMKMAEAEVDGSMWYTVEFSSNAVHITKLWVRKQDPAQWVDVREPGRLRDRFDLHEDLYTMLLLKWS